MQRASTRVPKGLKAREQKLTKMMGLIFGTFLLTYLPGVAIKVASQNDAQLHKIYFCFLFRGWLPAIHFPDKWFRRH